MSNSIKQKIKKHIEALRKSKEGKTNSERLRIAGEIDYWNDILSGKEVPTFKYNLPNGTNK